MALMFDLTSHDRVRLEACGAEATRLLRALGNERRLMILCQLVDGELSVGELMPRVGLSQSALSQHLAVLRAQAIVATRREGHAVRYRIADPAAVRVVETLVEIFAPDQEKLP